MTTTPVAVEQAPDAAEPEQAATPAQQALTVALTFAAAAQVGVEQRCRAWLAGRISATDLAYSGASIVLQAVAKALLASEHFAMIEWSTRVSPMVIAAGEHERLTRALFTVVRDAEQARASNLRGAVVAKVSEVTASPGEVSETSEVSDALLTRSTRLAHAEVVTAARVAYGEAVEQVVGDPDYAWRFRLSTNPCGRCVALAARTFSTFIQTPKQGAHVGCRCTAEVEMRTP
ncbi:hypothetical protein [Microlunatus flavus]|uniref:Phage Mu protein F like protein n=1 Tax=Microlunatus flavus TaxID=1036181 RepID=A0A1H9LM47_9ACTN|nr:hypothetical protein [Microlunatus flavus]SER12205.1 hypothetical protein SAMN05421756_1099 [Microlunatus flavus]